jgi:hypothetical protein
VKGGGLKDSREGALCDSGSLAGDLAEECSTAEKKIMMHDHERKSRQQAHGRRFTPCRKLPGRDSFPQRADARGSTGQPTLSPGSQGRDMCGDKSRVSPAVSNTKDAAGLEGPTQLRRVGKHRPLPYTRRTSAIGSAVSRATCTTQGCAGYLLPYGGDADPWRGARGPPRRLWHADEVALPFRRPVPQSPPSTPLQDPPKLSRNSLQKLLEPSMNPESSRGEGPEASSASFETV